VAAAGDDGRPGCAVVPHGEVDVVEVGVLKGHPPDHCGEVVEVGAVFEVILHLAADAADEDRGKAAPVGPVAGEADGRAADRVH
jgi:hypothetical protein